MSMFCMLWLAVLGGMDDWLKLTAKSRSGTRDGLKSWEKLLFQIGLGVLLGYFIYSHGQQNRGGAGAGAGGITRIVSAF